MSCLKCKTPTTLHPLCNRHPYCGPCALAIKKCQQCPMISGCTNCPNLLGKPLCIISDCKHRLCTDCLIQLSASKSYSCPLCNRPFAANVLEGYLNQVKDKQIQCRKCAKKGSQNNKDYFRCQHCGHLECSRHKNSMKKCLCKCLDCLRETIFDFQGRPLNCRCIASDTRIPERSPSPYRPASSKELAKHYRPFEPQLPRTTMKLDGSSTSQKNLRVQVRPLTPVNHKQQPVQRKDIQEESKQVVAGENNHLKVPPNPYFNPQYQGEKPQTATRPITPKNYPPIPIRSNSPNPTSTPLLPTQPSQLPPKKTSQQNWFPPNPSSTRSKSPIFPQANISPRLPVPKSESISPSKNQTKPLPKYEKWTCKKCQCVLECKMRRSGLCTFCSIMHTFSIKN